MDKTYTSPLLKKYQKIYESDPSSRVFAPLAETYRKLGVVDRAIEVLKEGIKNHPDYVMGYIGLAACYIDLQQWEHAYTNLRPFVAKYRDNLRLQKLFAKTCISLERKEEALETYKYLLFMNPRDQEAAQGVRELEDELGKQNLKLSNVNERDQSDGPAVFNVKDLDSGPGESLYNDDIEGWEAVDFSNTDLTSSTDDGVDASDWSMDSAETPAPVSLEVGETKEVSPEITHTLVDLYISRGDIDQAKEILEKILELNPNNQETKEKLKEVEELMFSEDDDGDKMPDVQKTEKHELTDKEKSKIQHLEKLLQGLKDKAKNFHHFQQS